MRSSFPMICKTCYLPLPPPRPVTITRLFHSSPIPSVKRPQKPFAYKPPRIGEDGRQIWWRAKMYDPHVPGSINLSMSKRGKRGKPLPRWSRGQHREKQVEYEDMDEERERDQASEFGFRRGATPRAGAGASVRTFDVDMDKSDREPRKRDGDQASSLIAQRRSPAGWERATGNRGSFGVRRDQSHAAEEYGRINDRRRDASPDARFDGSRQRLGREREDEREWDDPLRHKQRIARASEFGRPTDSPRQYDNPHRGSSFTPLGIDPPFKRITETTSSDTPYPRRGSLSATESEPSSTPSSTPTSPTKPSPQSSWQPTKKLTYAAMASLRHLHASDPRTYTRAVLSETFGISFEAVSRILRSKRDPLQNVTGGNAGEQTAGDGQGLGTGKKEKFSELRDWDGLTIKEQVQRYDPIPALEKGLRERERRENWRQQQLEQEEARNGQE